MQRVEKSIRVQAPVSQVYAYWRDFQNFPSFMANVESVTVRDGGEMSHWTIKGPLGRSVEFDARMTRDVPESEIAWNSEGGSIETTGNVTFTELNGETQVRVLMQWYDPPGGAIGETVADWLQDAEQMVEEDLHRFKHIVEGAAAKPGAR